MFKNINAGLIASRASFLTNRNRLLQTRLIRNSTGDQIYSSASGYVYHIFTSPGSFEVHTQGRVDIMLVGGGGGGGGITATPNNYADEGSGGGGAGGVSHHYNLPMPVSEYNVIIGSGGSSGTPGSQTQTTDAPTDGQGGRGNHTHIVHLKTEPVASPDGNYEKRDGSVATGQDGFFREWGTRIDPSIPTTSWQDDFYAHDPSNIPNSDYRYGSTRALTAFGGGGGGYTLNLPDPGNMPSHIPRAYSGGGGGSEGGRGSRFRTDAATARAPSYYSDPSYGAFELSRLSEHNELPQGNIGGGNHRPHSTSPGDRNGGGGGGGAGGSGTPGADSGPAGFGGIGVAAFGGDIGIPSDYGTVGPPSSPGTRWFGGGGMGGDNYYPSQIDSNGYYGGGGLSVPNNVTNYSRDAVTNTGGGGAGARSYNPYTNSVIEGAGVGGSGIVIIRYQAQL